MRKVAEIKEAFAPRASLSSHRSFFLVGIGGAGMSALARMLARRGFQVSGTDSNASDTTLALIVEDIPVHIGHTDQYLKAGDAIVLSDAIDLDSSPEVARALELGCPLYRRSQALGWLLSCHRLIAVTGTHGKTTTTGMVAAALRKAGLDPLAVVGAAIPDWGGPVLEGGSKWAVAEACEAYDSLQDFDPAIVLLTNLELDHVDFHGSYERLRDSVLAFAGRAELLVFCEEDPGACEIARLAGIRSVPYRLEDAPDGLVLSGRHNRLNAAGALAASIAAGADAKLASAGIAKFMGAERRLQVLHDGEIAVVDDYAHHPTEIEASVAALREKFPRRRLVVVFQPHLYSRTEGLIPEFAKALSMADEVVLTDIYPAREAPRMGVSSARIAESIDSSVRYVPSRHLLPRTVLGLVMPGDVIVGMGAGNISEFARSFLGIYLRRASGKATRVAVLYGGESAEREVSLHSGLAVHEALLLKGYESSLVDLTDRFLGHGDVSSLIGDRAPDVVFLAVHGTNAEDGALQGLLEFLHIPYTGSGIEASALCMNKDLTKSILAAQGIRVPKGERITERGGLPSLEPPLVVKPNAQGSTVGLSFVEDSDHLKRAIDKAFAYDGSVLVEEWIRGTEISVPVLGDRALPVVEIVPTSGRYDFASKYVPGATEEIIPARLAPNVTRAVQELALKAHEAMGCSGATRTDMIVRDETPYVLEVNTLPGMTPTSLLPNSAKAGGIAFEDLVDWMVKDALKRHAKAKK